MVVGVCSKTPSSDNQGWGGWGSPPAASSSRRRSGRSPRPTTPRRSVGGRRRLRQSEGEKSRGKTLHWKPWGQRAGGGGAMNPHSDDSGNAPEGAKGSGGVWLQSAIEPSLGGGGVWLRGRSPLVCQQLPEGAVRGRSEETAPGREEGRSRAQSIGRLRLTPRVCRVWLYEVWGRRAGSDRC